MWAPRSRKETKGTHLTCRSRALFLSLLPLDLPLGASEQGTRSTLRGHAQGLIGWS